MEAKETAALNKLNGLKKWNLKYRTMPVREGYEWLQCQAGRFVTVKGGPKLPPESVFQLLGFGYTMIDAEKMAEQRLAK